MGVMNCFSQSGDMAVLSKPVRPAAPDTEGTVPPIDFPTYGYRHCKIIMLTLAEEEHDAMLFGSLDEEPSTILGAHKAISPTSSHVELSSFDATPNPPSATPQLPRRRPVKFEIGPPSSSSSSSTSLERLFMEHNQSENLGLESSIPFLDLSAEG
ncbi:hypothetical protein BZA77DRAFT_340860 [Pyronema omphalodes]|nr:hypothetical protein BZA77DRAFT_340860 [Pyronema omphalodes]